MRRALELYRLDLRVEGNREWLWTIRGFDDKQLLVGGRGRAASRGLRPHDQHRGSHRRAARLHLRYLAPYRDVLKVRAAQLELDEAWVYGLIRQESRFIADASSHAGASGLMQLMPGTAKWVARKSSGSMTSARRRSPTSTPTWSLGTLLPAACAGRARRPAGARLGRLQRRPGPRARVAPRQPRRRRDLRRKHPVQRDPRLRQEGHGEHELLRRTTSASRSSRSSCAWGSSRPRNRGRKPSSGIRLA